MQTSCFQVMSARIIINNGKLIRKKTTPKRTKHFVHGTQSNACFSIIVTAHDNNNDHEYEIEKNQLLYKLNTFYFYSNQFWNKNNPLFMLPAKAIADHLKLCGEVKRNIIILHHLGKP